MTYLVIVNTKKMSGKEFKLLLDQVSNSTSSETNWAAIMEIVEMIKRKDFPAKKASGEIRKKLLDSKESVVLNTLYIVEAVVKNTPGPVHRDFLSQELLGSMKAIVEGQNAGMSRAIDKVLEVLGEWKAAFGDDTSYKPIVTIFNDLEKGGYYIPEANLASASYMQKPPDFQESDQCYLCSKEFGGLLFKGRHHCRNCGKSICNSCLGENRLPLPHFGIDTPQRVCITCSKKLDKQSSEASVSDNTATGANVTSSSPQPPNQQELQMQEEEDIQMAIAISLNEQENKKKTSTSVPVSVAPSTTIPVAPPTTIPSAPPPSLYTPLYAELDFTPSAVPLTNQTVPTIATTTVSTDQGMSEFEQYSTRGQKQKEAVHSTTIPTTQEQQQGHHPLCTTLLQLIEQFDQRMQLINGRGGSIATDRAILSMHQNLTALHLQLLQQIDEVHEEKVNQERVLHKIGESKEARITFDTMRRRHQEQLLQQEREQQALAQMQVQMKLALLRQQKAEQMAYGQSMQYERLNRLSNQRAVYEQSLATQRDYERQKLMTLEEQVYQQQFGQLSAPPPVPVETQSNYMAPPPSITYNVNQPIGYVPPESYAPPIPTKVEPPPYQPLAPPQNMYQPPPALYQPEPIAPPTLTSLASEPHVVPPPQQQYVAPPQYMTPPNAPPYQYTQQPYTLPTTVDIPLHQSNETHEAQRVPSLPPLISFD